MSKQPAYLCRRRPSSFRPVPLRKRRDGWSAERQCEFLAQLYFTGSVRDAARTVGMSRASAYRLRARHGAQDFARAWDHVLTPPGPGRIAGLKPDWRKVTQSQLIGWLEAGLVQPVLYRDAMTSTRRKADNSAVFRLLRRGGAGSAMRASQEAVR